MGDLIAMLIEFVATIWWTDAELRERSSMSGQSEFDLASRRFVARLCGGGIALLLVAGLVWWWYSSQ